MLELIIIRGVPGTGKTTLAITEYVPRGYVHCENDQYWGENRPAQFTRQDWDAAKAFCFRKVTEAMKAGQNVVVSNTFTQHWQYGCYLWLAKKYGYEVKIIRLTHEYGSVHNIPEAEMRHIRALWED